MDGGRRLHVRYEYWRCRVQDVASTCQVAPSPVKLVVLEFTEGGIRRGRRG